MLDLLGAMTPHEPTTILAWFHIAALGLAGAVKVFRGCLMQRRARRIDTFGWSIISFDYIFGIGLLLGAFWAFYPQTHTRWLDALATGALLIASLWQGVMIYTAPVHRIDTAMQSPQPPEWKPGDPERRSGGDRRKPENTSGWEVNS